MDKLLITGGSGMLAQHVAEAAQACTIDVALADVAWPDGRVWVEGTERLTFDIRDRDACREAVRGVRAIIHCAAVVGPARAKADPLVAVEVNVKGTANLLEAAADAGVRMLNVSTATLYGHRPQLEPLEETATPEPLSIYDGTKLMSETYCSAHRRTFGSDVASFRTGFVYGRGNQIGEYFLPSAADGVPVRETAGAGHPCDFTYVVDLAEGLLSAAMAPALEFDVYNLTGGVLRTRGELADAVRKLVPSAVIEIAGGIDPKRHLRGACVLERAKANFGWSPRFSLETGLADWLNRLRVAR